ncbi:tryptophan synthase subunit alpha [Alkalibacillus sp. S2W]|uniref:tryptophan synthase subunit alpha n=1 Tax=Alkalibacillus sp. S2W TaxID=3386553 RepID=UPI00398CDD90
METIKHGKQYMQAVFNQTLEQNEKIFVPYIMAGDGGIESLMPTLQQLDQAGATTIEIGIPFSDPVADGPTIQEAGKRARETGVTLHQILDKLAEERHSIKAPIIVMTYLNPIFQFGVDRFMEVAQSAGIDGLIIPDLPLEHESFIREAKEQHGLALIQLVSLTSSKERIKQIAEASEGFLYAVTVNGITGARQSFADDLATHFELLQTYSDVPVLAGFGISTPDHVKNMTKVADGVVVGSQIIQSLQANDTDHIHALINAKDNQ